MIPAQVFSCEYENRLDWRRSGAKNRRDLRVVISGGEE